MREGLPAVAESEGTRRGIRRGIERSIVRGDYGGMGFYDMGEKGRREEGDESWLLIPAERSG